MLASFKTKVLKNTLIYYIYRYYKYKFKYFSSYSAHGEDVFIKKFFKNVKKGFFVDVGALHPINGSLTYNLYLNGWRGINIDMIKENLMLFNIFRKGDTNLNSAVSSRKGLIDAFFFEQGSGVNTNSQKWADMWSKKFKKVYKKRKVKKDTLDNILNNNLVNKNFDLLNIDVEGHELDVLKGLNLKLYKPKLISVEIHVKKTKDIFSTKVYKYLNKFSYEIVSQYNQTSFFIPKNNLNIFKKDKNYK